MKKSKMLSGEFAEEDVNEKKLRPLCLDDFQGQHEIKDNLKVFLKAAKERRESLDHVFLSGPPGLGKTTLAYILANEMGSEFKVTSAPALDKPKDLAGLLTSINEHTIFFIDEIHRLKPVIEEMLYIAMEDFELDWIIGQGPSARSVRIPVPSFTLVGATTKSGNVSSPLYSRFGINIRMNLYNQADIINILKRSSKILDIPCDEKAIKALSACCRGTPRVANRLLRRVRDFAQVKGDGVVSEDIVKYSLGKLNIDPLGLEACDREILDVIINKYSGGPVGAETIAISVGETVETLEDFYEPYLIQLGMIKRTPRGRVATQLAYDHLQIIRKEDNIENQRLLF